MSRQTDRTRAALIQAFTEIALSINYEKIRMADVASRANVGRSTMYLHYPNKDTLLLDSMSWVLDGLARCIEGQHHSAFITPVLHHVWEHRDKARRILFGTTGQKLERALVERILQKVTEMPPQNPWVISPVIVAHQISAGIFTPLRIWVAAEASAGADLLTDHLCRSATALLQAGQGNVAGAMDPAENEKGPTRNGVGP